MHILKMSRSTMDMQLNVGHKTLSYICKYISKSEDLLKATVAGGDGGWKRLVRSKTVEQCTLVGK